MKKNVRFYVCPICGNQIGMIKNNGPEVMCCGESMKVMEANSSDAAHEKHVPVYTRVEDEIVVKIGEIEHPMEKEHYIMWVALVSDNRTERVTLFPEQDTTVRLKYIPNATLYAYCNKHGLWKTEVE